MYLPPIHIQSIRSNYVNFSSQPLSQKILKITLPLVGLFFLGVAGLALVRCLKRRVSTTLTLVNSFPLDKIFTKKTEGLTNPVPPKLYNGVRNKANSQDLQYQSHRWMSETNLQTLVKLSTGVAYPANQIQFDHPDAVSYILAESPLNNDMVLWKEDYYRMAIEKNAALLLSVASPYKNDESLELDSGKFDFVTYGNPVTFGEYTIKCVSTNPIVINELYVAYELSISRNGEDQKTLWHLMPRKAPDTSFAKIQEVVEMVNKFIQDKKLTLDSQHPLLVNCRSGLDRTGRFILFHDLQRHLENLIRSELKKNRSASDSDIMKTILGTQDISEVIQNRARGIECLSSKTAAIGIIQTSVLPNFDGTANCPTEKVNAIYRDHVLQTIKYLKSSEFSTDDSSKFASEKD